MIRRLGLSFLILLLAALVVGAGWLAGTPSGTRVAIAWTSALLPGVKLRHASGTLLGPLVLAEVDVSWQTGRLAIDRLRLDWQPACLLGAEVCLRDLQAQRLTLRLSPPPAPAGGAAAAPRPLPQIRMPLALDVGRLALDEFVLVRGERRTLLRNVEATFAWQGTTLAVDRLAVAGQAWAATASGRLESRDDWPLDTRLQWAVVRDGQPLLALAGTAAGTLRATQLDLDSSGLVESRLTGTLATTVPGMPFTLAASAARLRVPPGAPDDRASFVEDVRLTAGGELTGTFRIDGDAQVDTPWTPPLPATLAVTATLRGITDGHVRLQDPRLDATLQTRWDWIGGQRFAFDADIAHLDLSLFHPALASSLAGRARFAGDLGAGTQRVDIDVEDVAGTLGSRALAASGRLRWDSGLLRFDDFTLRQGANRARLTGVLAETWDVEAALTLDAVGTLVPGFEGTATGQAQVGGSRTDPHFRFSLDAPALALPAVPLPAPVDRTLRLPVVAWSIAGEATLRGVRLDAARTRDPDHEISATGTVDWAQGLQWDIEAQLARFPLARLAPELGGRVGGRFATRGDLGDSLRALAIDTTLAGALDGQPLAVDARLDWSPTALAVPRLSLRHGANRLTAAGSLRADDFSLALDTEAPDLAASFRDAAGALSATLRYAGPLDAPTGAGSLAARRLHLTGINGGVDSLSATLQLADGAQSPSSATLAVRGLTAPGITPADIVLTAQGTRARLATDLALRQDVLAVALAARGTLDAAGWNGLLTAGEVQWRDWRWTPATMPALQLTRDGATLAAHCWTDGIARACLSAPAVLGRDGSLAAEAFHLPAGRLIAESLPAEAIVTGTLGGTVTADWQAGTLVRLAADLRNGLPVGFGERLDNGRVRMATRLDSLVATAGLDAEGSRLHATATGDTLGRLTLGLARTRDGELSGLLDITGGNIGIANAFAWQVQDIGGTLDARLALGGTDAAPTLSGQVSLRDGRAGLVRAPLAVEQVRLDGRIDGRRLDVTGSFRTPEAREAIDVDGAFTLRGRAWHGQARVRGRELVVALPPQYRFTLAPDLQVQLANRRVHLAGTVGVPHGRLEVKSLPERSVERSGDVIIVREDVALGAEDPVFRRSMDVLLTLGDDVQFKAFGAEGGLAGNLRVRTQPALPLLVDGELRVRDGHYTVFGQKLGLRQADIIFNGPAEQPLVDAVAFRELDDPAVKEVGVRLSGSLRHPETTLWSTPELPQEQALTWLLTGHGLSDAPTDLRGEAAQAALALGIAQGSALLNQAGRQLGLRELQLSAGGDGEDAELQVGTALSERVWLGYNRRVFSGENSLLLRLRMTRRLVLEALSGLESAVDLFYTFEFGNKPP